MRISTEAFFRQFTQSLQNQQTSVAKLQEQISYGRKIITPADDPVGAARTVNISQTIGRIEQFIRNGSYAEQRLGVEETTLSSVTNLLQRVRELAVKASNIGAQSSETFTAVKTELEQNFKELLNLANTRDSTGEYLFSGFQGQTKPFVETPAGVQFNGDQGQLQLQIGTSKNVAVSDSGYELFLNIKNGNGKFFTTSSSTNTGNAVLAPGSVIDNTAFAAEDFTISFTSATTYDVINNTSGATVTSGATYTENAAIIFNGLQVSINGQPQTGDEFYVRASRNQDMFSMLESFISTMGSYPDNTADRAQTQQAMQAALQNIDQALNHIIVSRAEVGARRNSIETSNEENEAVAFELTRNLSEIRDLDYAEAISTLQYQLTSLEAAEKSFAVIQRLSLFDFIR